VNEQNQPLTNAQIRAAGEAGAKSAIDRWEAEKKALRELNRDIRFRNIKTLLQNYHVFKAAAEGAIYCVEQAEEEADIDWKTFMWDPWNKADAIVESIKRSALNTQITVLHIDAMLAGYEAWSNKRNEVAQRRFKILYDRFLREEQLSMDEIISKYSIEKRTAYDDIDEAIKIAALFMFGIEFVVNP
jgi:hypothetical protein